VFLVSLKAGGVALNLTEVSTISIVGNIPENLTWLGLSSLFNGQLVEPSGKSRLD
jgi:hypothetical protein